jgi:hypothetical protein
MQLDQTRSRPERLIRAALCVMLLALGVQDSVAAAGWYLLSPPISHKGAKLECRRHKRHSQARRPSLPHARARMKRYYRADEEPVKAKHWVKTLGGSGSFCERSFTPFRMTSLASVILALRP